MPQSRVTARGAALTLSALSLSALALVPATGASAHAAPPPAAERSTDHAADRGPERGAAPTVRFQTFNASLNRAAEGELVADLSTRSDPQAAAVAEIIQHTRPDVLLINEFDYAPAAVDLLRENYLEVPQGEGEPIEYPYAFIAPSNTGVPSGHDLDNDGAVGGGNDAYGFGEFPGQYGMLVLSRFPIQTEDVRLSSKSHWDVPVRVGGRTVHFLVSHPTPPTFDGAEDRNGTRNHDEIRFWADYVSGPRTSGYIYDDEGRRGGLRPGSAFVVAGDQNSDPEDGDSVPGAIQQLLDHPRVVDPLPTSAGGPEAAARQGGANATHTGDPAYDTADFADTAPGNLRADYVLGSRQLPVVDAGVFWPTPDQPLSRLTGEYPFPSSDHRAVWVDFRLKG